MVGVWIYSIGGKQMKRTRAIVICLPVDGDDHAFTTTTRLLVTLTMEGWMASESTRIVSKGKRREKGLGPRRFAKPNVTLHHASTPDASPCPVLLMGHPVPSRPVFQCRQAKLHVHRAGPSSSTTHGKLSRFVGCD